MIGYKIFKNFLWTYRLLEMEMTAIVEKRFHSLSYKKYHWISAAAMDKQIHGYMLRVNETL